MHVYVYIVSVISVSQVGPNCF